MCQSFSFTKTKTTCFILFSQEILFKQVNSRLKRFPLENMGQPQRRKKMHSGDTHLRRRWRLRSRKKDLDEVTKPNYVLL